MSDGQKAIKLLKEDFPILLQQVIKQVADLSDEISALNEDFIGFDFEVDKQEEAGPVEMRSLRVYWYSSIPVPRVVYAFLQRPVQATSLVYLMGEATPGGMAIWHPQADGREAKQALIAEAFNSGQLQLEVFERFIAEIREMLPTIRESVIGELKRVSSGS